MLVMVVHRPRLDESLGLEAVGLGDGNQQSFIAHHVVDQPVGELVGAHEPAQVPRLDTGLNHEFSQLLRILGEVLQADVGQFGDGEPSGLEGQDESIPLRDS